MGVTGKKKTRKYMVTNISHADQNGDRQTKKRRSRRRVKVWGRGEDESDLASALKKEKSGGKTKMSRQN